MIRLIGILTGSAIAVAILIVALGVPEFAAPDKGTSDSSMPVDQIAYEPMSGSVTKPQVAAALEFDAPEIDAQDTEARAEPDTVVAEIAETPVPEDHSEVVAARESVQEIPAQQWYAFWSPFRSEIAADGFVSQLQRTTGLDYRVVKLKPGVYEVAFAYSDNSDVEDKLAQISTATGLDLSGG